MRVYDGNKIHYLFLWLFWSSVLVDGNIDSPQVLHWSWTQLEKLYIHSKLWTSRAFVHRDFFSGSLESIFISIFSSEFNVWQLTGNFLAETIYFFTLLWK